MVDTLPPERLPPPSGFASVSSTSPFVSRFGTYFVRSQPDGSATLGTWLDQTQADSDGTIDRRFLAMFADFALTDVTNAITLQISIECLGAARAGDWIEAVVVIHGKAGSLIFAEAVIADGGGRTLMRVRGTLTPFKRRAPIGPVESGIK
jgi:hypothetical protein